MAFPASDFQLVGSEPAALLNALERLHPVVLAFDSDSRVVWMSEACRGLCDDASGYLGKPVESFFENLWDVPNPGDLRGQVALIIERVETNQSAIEYDFEFSSKEGSAFGSKLKLLRVANHPGNPLSVCVLPFENSTEIPTPTNPNERNIKAMLELFPDAGFSIDDQGLLVDANSMVSSLFGIDAEQITGKSVAIFRSHSARLADRLAHLSGAEDTVGEEFQITQPDGSTAWILLSTRRLEMREGSRSRHLAWVRDIGKHALRVRELELAISKLDEYIHNIAHDLRTPLVSMLGFAQLLRKDYDQILDESGRRFTERIEQGAKKLDALIEKFSESPQVDFVADHKKNDS